MRLSALLLGVCSVFQRASVVTALPAGNWQLVWSDEFDGTTLDRSKWTPDVTCWGGGNNEQQCYVDSTENIYLQNGALNLKAKYVPGGYMGMPTTSGLVRSNRAVGGNWLYGYYEVRARMPRGNFLWPAIWMLPQTNTYGGWAASGEIDIFEYRGQGNVRRNGGQTLHFGGAFPNNVWESSGELTFPADLSADFHVYAVEWTRDRLTFSVDGIATKSWNLAERNFYGGRGPNPYTATRQPFDKPFYMILNTAVAGGYFDPNRFGTFNPPADTQTWTQPALQIDYVRIYQPGTGNPPPPPSPAPALPSKSPVVVQPSKSPVVAQPSKSPVVAQPSKSPVAAQPGTTACANPAQGCVHFFTLPGLVSAKAGRSLQYTAAVLTTQRAIDLMSSIVQTDTWNYYGGSTVTVQPSPTWQYIDVTVTHGAALPANNARLDVMLVPVGGVWSDRWTLITDMLTVGELACANPAQGCFALTNYPAAVPSTAGATFTLKASVMTTQRAIDLKASLVSDSTNDYFGGGVVTVQPKQGWQTVTLKVTLARNTPITGMRLDTMLVPVGGDWYQRWTLVQQLIDVQTAATAPARPGKLVTHNAHNAAAEAADV